MQASIFGREWTLKDGEDENKKPSKWQMLSKISPHQIQQLQQVKQNLKESDIRHRNIQAAFTYGRKISTEEISQPDY